MDGAREWQIALRISLPLIKPMLLIILVLRLSTAMGVLVEYLIMRSQDSLHPWTVYMYNLAFQNAQPMAYAAAIGWVGAAIMLVVALGPHMLLRPDPAAH